MSLFDVLISNFASDSVAVFDNNFKQVFFGASPIKATVKESVKVMEHPAEDGSVITDHEVIQPVEIEIAVMLTGFNYRSVYQQMRSLMRRGVLLTVQTKTSSYSNMLINDLPHEEDPEFFDKIVFGMKLREAQFVSSQFGTLPAQKVADKTKATTKDLGNKQAQPATPRQASTGARTFDSVSKYFGF